IEDCPCPTESSELDKAPRADGLCKVDVCNYITENTAIETCPCPTDPTKLQQDPRKDGLCKVVNKCELKVGRNSLDVALACMRSIPVSHANRANDHNQPDEAIDMSYLQSGLCGSLRPIATICMMIEN
ncbi:MAG: hypothetical protein EZS28_030419, partial [Streblomastix strix]